MTSLSIGNHPGVQHLLRDQLGEDHGVVTEVHPADEMFAYCRRAYGGSPALGAVEYFRTGLLAAETFSQLLAHHFGSPRHTPNVLDFASGFADGWRHSSTGSSDSSTIHLLQT